MVVGFLKFQLDKCLTRAGRSRKDLQMDGNGGRSSNGLCLHFCVVAVTNIKEKCQSEVPRNNMSLIPIVTVTIILSSTKRFGLILFTAYKDLI